MFSSPGRNSMGHKDSHTPQSSCLWSHEYRSSVGNSKSRKGTTLLTCTDRATACAVARAIVAKNDDLGDLTCKCI